VSLLGALVVALLVVTVTAAPAFAAGAIRVAVVEGARAVEVAGADVAVTALGGCPHCPAAAWRSPRVRAAAGAAGAVDVDGRRVPGVRLASERPLRVNGRLYRGPLEIIRVGEALAVVNEVPLEEYLVGVVRAETGDRWPAEALRAQAIVARTYATYHRVIATAAGKPFHLVASTAHQMFAGHVTAASPAWAAVRETAGQVILWEGEVFPAFYHAESGGYTEDPRTVFAAPNMPGLSAVRCDFSAGSPHFYWSLDLRLADLSETLRRHDAGVGAVTAIDVVERSPSLRAATVVVRGTRGAVQLRGNDFRRMVGYETLRSTLFAVVVDRGWARFSGRGYGHGVGMCQWGAKAMAEQGHTARQILEFYYPGTTFGVLEAAPGT
jgi:stage II sporulation protein D